MISGRTDCKGGVFFSDAVLTDNLSECRRQSEKNVNDVQVVNEQDFLDQIHS